jgi:hypothetical protein
MSQPYEEVPMPLRGRVGRHANTGAHCQNWTEDQQTVIALLNRIPVSDGGAGGSLGGRVIAGLSSDALFQAILRFEKQHFPANQWGFVDPGGAVLTRMEMLASRAAPAAAPPKAAGQWDNLKSGSVTRALRKGLKGDLTLDHPEVVDIIRSTLSNGIVSASELADLSTVAATSRSILPRSKAMLEMFVVQVKSTVAGKGPYSLPTPKHVFAADMICDFLQRSGRTYFPKLDRDEIGVGLLMRIANPGTLRQGQASLCGPTALLFNLVSDQPGQYARFAIDLYEKGRAKIGRLLIEPGGDIRTYRPPPGSIHPVDWMTMASIRDSENYFFDYDSIEAEFAGITLPGELAHWFRLAGYSDVREETNVYFNKGTGTLDDATRLFSNGYRVCMFINAKMLDAKEQTESSTIPDHWVVLRSPIARSGGKVTLKVFTWGNGDYQIPQAGDLSQDDFLGNFYGYVAGKA